MTALSTLQDRVVVGNVSYLNNSGKFNFAISLASAKVSICVTDFHLQGRIWHLTAGVCILALAACRVEVEWS